MGSAPHLAPGARTPAATPDPARGRPVDSSAVRPFLKWAGGKRQLLPVLRRFYPREFGTYHEPFLGSGAVFFDLAGAGRVAAGRIRLTDVNADLIGCWLRLRDQRDAVVAGLRRLEAGHRAAPVKHFYRIRNEKFNPARRKIMNGTGPRAEKYSANLAAMFIYLNRTGFNGLFRLNAAGLFNVPRGSYANPGICDEDNLRRVSSTLAELSATVEHAPFESVLRSALEGDFVYFDPPYAPLSSTASFTSYTADRFGADDQRRLQQVVIALAKRGCHVLLSNSTAAEISDLYVNNCDAKRAGLWAQEVEARRDINSDASRRGRVKEYVITNLPEAEDVDGSPETGVLRRPPGTSG